jgi:hypothetical protein
MKNINDGIKVQGPSAPPVLTPRAARALLRILVAANERRAAAEQGRIAA